jgi:hypothetical protein
MSERSWLQLAELAGQSTPIGPLLSALRILRTSVEETGEELRVLQEEKLIAGQGFLERAEREPSHRIDLIVDAQGCFTHLILHPKPMLASRANFFVGFCHNLLGRPPDMAAPYYVKAFSLAMTAVEVSEHDRASLVGHLVPRLPSQLKRKHGVSYQSLFCRRTGLVYFPAKDSYMRSLESVTRTPLLICCVDAVEDLCPKHRLDSSFVSGSGKHTTIFSSRSEYFVQKSATLAAVSAALEKP